MKPLIEGSGKRGLRINQKRKNFGTFNKEHKKFVQPTGNIASDKTHPSVRGEFNKKSKQKKLEERNARQSENSSARITLKQEITEIQDELYDDTNFSIGHSHLIDSPSYVARKIKELNK